MKPLPKTTPRHTNTTQDVTGQHKTTQDNTGQRKTKLGQIPLTNSLTSKEGVYLVQPYIECPRGGRPKVRVKVRVRVGVRITAKVRVSGKGKGKGKGQS